MFHPHSDPWVPLYKGTAGWAAVELPHLLPSYCCCKSGFHPLFPIFLCIFTSVTKDCNYCRLELFQVPHCLGCRGKYRCHAVVLQSWVVIWLHRQGYYCYPSKVCTQHYGNVHTQPALWEEISFLINLNETSLAAQWESEQLAGVRQNKTRDRSA